MTNPSELSPIELLELTGQSRPPVRLAPIIEYTGKQWAFGAVNFPRTSGNEHGSESGTDWIIIPKGARAKQPGINIAIAHDLRQALLGQPGNYTDIAFNYAKEEEERYDAWARQLVMPAPWFSADTSRKPKVKDLAQRYNVTTDQVLDRALELELCSRICRDRESYSLYCRHRYWAKRRRIAYLTTHPRCEIVVGHKPCGQRAASVHHLPHGYGFLGRELDEHLRSVCFSHHNAQHLDKGQMELF